MSTLCCFRRDGKCMLMTSQLFSRLATTPLDATMLNVVLLGPPHHSASTLYIEVCGYLCRLLLCCYSSCLAADLPGITTTACCCGKLQSPKCCFESTVFFRMMTPIDIIPSPCAAQASHRSACKTTCHHAPFRSLSCEHANGLSVIYLMMFHLCVGLSS